MGENDLKNLDKDSLVNAANFALAKFLIRSELVAKESQVLERKFQDLQTKVRLKKINSVIQNIK